MENDDVSLDEKVLAIDECFIYLGSIKSGDIDQDVTHMIKSSGVIGERPLEYYVTKAFLYILKGKGKFDYYKTCVAL